VPRLRGDNQSERSSVRGPCLERRLQQLNIAEARQVLTSATEHFWSGIHRDNGEATLGKAFCCLARATANFENVVALLEIGV
jgi:hypothetical protein